MQNYMSENKESETLNEINKAMIQLKQKKQGEAIQTLKLILNQFPDTLETIQQYMLKGTVLNNIGSAYKHLGKIHMAIKHFQQVAQLYKRCNYLENEVIHSYLKLSSIYSQQKKHEKALKYAFKSLKILQLKEPKSVEQVTRHIVTYHHIAKEYEATQNLNKALNYYREAYNLSHKHLGHTNSLTSRLQKLITEIQVAIYNSQQEIVNPIINIRSKSYNKKRVHTNRPVKRTYRIRENKARFNSSLPKVAKESPYKVSFSETDKRTRLRRMQDEQRRKTFRSASPQQTQFLRDRIAQYGKQFTIRNTIKSISSRIDKLQQKVNDFGKKCRPMAELLEEKEDSEASIYLDTYDIQVI